jgi:hypothetical protein
MRTPLTEYPGISIAWFRADNEARIAQQDLSELLDKKIAEFNAADDIFPLFADLAIQV